MNGHYTYFAFVAVLLAVLAVKYGWLVVENYLITLMPLWAECE